MTLPPEGRGNRRIQGGIATSDVTLSAHIGGNADVFAQILRLHVPEGAIVADATWGKGVFGRKSPRESTMFGPPTYQWEWIAGSCRTEIAN